MSEEIDDAFDWLILVISTISGILIGLPGTTEGKKIVAGWLIPPFFCIDCRLAFKPLNKKAAYKGEFEIICMALRVTYDRVFHPDIQ